MPVLQPLPDVARHVVKAVAVGRLRRHLPGGLAAVARVPAHVPDLVGAREDEVLAPPRGELPLGLGGQAVAAALHGVDGGAAQHVRLGPAAVVAGLQPVGGGHRVGERRGFEPADLLDGALGAAGREVRRVVVHERGELRLRDLRAADPESPAQGDGVGGQLLRLAPVLARRAAHLEGRRAEQDEVHALDAPRLLAFAFRGGIGGFGAACQEQRREQEPQGPGTPPRGPHRSSRESPEQAMPDPSNMASSAASQ